MKNMKKVSIIKDGERVIIDLRSYELLKSFYLIGECLPVNDGDDGYKKGDYLRYDFTSAEIIDREARIDNILKSREEKIDDILNIK